MPRFYLLEFQWLCQCKRFSAVCSHDMIARSPCTGTLVNLLPTQAQRTRPISFSQFEEIVHCPPRDWIEHPQGNLCKLARPKMTIAPKCQLLILLGWVAMVCAEEGTYVRPIGKAAKSPVCGWDVAHDWLGSGLIVWPARDACVAFTHSFYRCNAACSGPRWDHWLGASLPNHGPIQVTPESEELGIMELCTTGYKITAFFAHQFPSPGFFYCFWKVHAVSPSLRALTGTPSGRLHGNYGKKRDEDGGHGRGRGNEDFERKEHRVACKLCRHVGCFGRNSDSAVCDGCESLGCKE